MKFIAKKFNVFTYCMQIILINILNYEIDNINTTFFDRTLSALRLAMRIRFLIASKDELNLQVVRAEYI